MSAVDDRIAALEAGFDVACAAPSATGNASSRCRCRPGATQIAIQYRLEQQVTVNACHASHATAWLACSVREPLREQIVEPAEHGSPDRPVCQPV